MISHKPKAEAAAKAPKGPLPHDDDRGSNQPYAKETEDYQGGVAAPPKENPANPPPLKDTKRDPASSGL
jgi:hypothetical protein